MFYSGVAFDRGDLAFEHCLLLFPKLADLIVQCFVLQSEFDVLVEEIGVLGLETSDHLDEF